MGADRGWVAGAAIGPLTSALKAAKAVMVGSGEFRALDENAHPIAGSKSAGRGFQVWELKDRIARYGELRRDCV